MTLRSFGAPRQPRVQNVIAPTVAFTGISGTTYAFEVHPLGTFFQSLPGIYVICKEAPPKTLNALYVGEAHDFDNRVGEGFPTHHKWAAAIVRGATHICVMVVSGDNAARLRIERDLRHGFNPPLNDQ